MGKKSRKKTSLKARKKIHKGKKHVSVFSEKRNLWAVLLILAITFIAFFPSLSNDFVNWDDDYNILNNPNLDQFDWEHIVGIFTSNVIGNYNPLSIFTFAVEKHLFGLDPFVFHLNNVLLHLICVFLVFKLGSMLRLNAAATIILTCLFAIHPMRVESVTWITERKDVLFAAFYFWALLIYARGVFEGQKKWDTALIIVLFILSGLSKIQAVSLPLSMLAIDYLAKNKLSLKLILQKSHYFIISLVIGLVGIYFLQEQGSLEATAVHGPIDRILIGLYSYSVYVVKSIFPFQLSPLYPYNDPLKWHEYLGIPGILLIGGILWYAWKKNLRVLLFGFLFFTVNIIFLLQILGAGQGYLADRFTYVAYFGLFYAYGFYISKTIKKWSAPNTKIAMGILVAVGLLYAYWTFQQTKVWQNSGTLWTHVIKYYQNTPLPYGNRANYYRDEGMIDLALSDYQRAIELDPQRHAAYNSRGKLYFDQGNFDQALVEYQKAISIVSDNGEYHTNLGATLGMLGRIPEAIESMSRGLELRPNFTQGYANRAVMYNQIKNHQKAMEDLETFISMNPYNGDIWYEKGRTHRMMGQTESALTAYNKAIELDNSKGLFFLERSRTHFQLGNLPAARQDMRTAEQMGTPINPNYKLDLGL